MVSKETVVMNESGLHARPASKLVELANTFHSDIYLRKPEDPEPGIVAKSILAVIGLGISTSTEIVVSATGPDENEAVQAIVDLIDSDFAE